MVPSLSKAVTATLSEGVWPKREYAGKFECQPGYIFCKKSLTALLHAGLDIGNFACGNEVTGPTVRTIDNQIDVVAIAAALSFTQVNVTCAVQGDARATFEGTAFASARAEAYAEAVSNVLASNDICPNCTAVVEAVVRTSRRIVADAFASVAFQVQ